VVKMDHSIAVTGDLFHLAMIVAALIQVLISTATTRTSSITPQPLAGGLRRAMAFTTVSSVTGLGESVLRRECALRDCLRAEPRLSVRRPTGRLSSESSGAEAAFESRSVMLGGSRSTIRRASAQLPSRHATCTSLCRGTTWCREGLN
jgi:hypothetical protein